MERTQKFRLAISIAVGFFGVFAAILGIAAEVKHIRADDVVVIGDDCFYPSNPAWILGLLSASFLLVSQLIANACGGCICCCRSNNSTISQSSTSRTVAILCLILSWISFSNAFFLLLEGAAVNGQQQYAGQGMVHSCYIIKSGVFAAGAALSLFTCTLSIIYYLMATSFNGIDGGEAIGEPAVHHRHHNIVTAPMFAYSPDYTTRYSTSSFNSKYASNPYVPGLELPKHFHQNY